MSVYLKTSQIKTTIDSDKISKQMFSSLWACCWKISFEIYVNAGLSQSAFEQPAPRV